MALSAIGRPMIEKNKPSHLHVSKPKAGWLLLPRAVFRFGAADEANATANNSSKNEAMEATTTSLPQLHAILKETSGATHVKIDPARCAFVFQFSHGGSTWGGPPWALLGNIEEAKPSLDPRADAEALFNKEGLVRIGDEEAAIGLREHGAVRRATGLVWRQYMLREFDRAVAANEIALFARVGSAIAPFEALPPDVWPLLNMLDWQNAIAREPEGLLLYSVHAQRAKVAISTARDENAAIRCLGAELAHHPHLKRADAEAWCKKTGFRLSHTGFRFRVWPQARQRAGLKEIASPGRKRKSVG